MKAKEYTISPVKELVSLRTKPMKNGGKSLFLDYSIGGVRHKDYLRMYLVPERTKIDKFQNAETMKTALAMKAKMTIDIQNGIGGLSPKVSDALLFDFLKEQCKEYMDAGKTEYAKGIEKLEQWLELYGKNIVLRQVDREYVISFFNYLRSERTNLKEKKGERRYGRPRSWKGLGENTIRTYYLTLSTMFNRAVRRRLMARNPMHDLEPHERPQPRDPEREYLTLDEVRTLMATECGNRDVKRAFLFSCFTGLRISDVERLTPDKFRPTDSGMEVELRQQKTGQIVHVPLASNAIAFLPDPMPKEGHLFALPSRTEINIDIRRWVSRAGIEKHITFHCSRHTFATLLLTYGADIYTVSKLLGHTDVQNTQVYAKVIDSKRKAAVDSIPSLGL